MFDKPGNDKTIAESQAIVGTKSEIAYWVFVVFFNVIFTIVMFPLISGDAIGYYAHVLILIFINAGFVRQYFTLRYRVKQGELTVNDKAYQFVIGDTLTWYVEQDKMAGLLTASRHKPFGKAGRRYKGIKVILPAHLPHVYLDSQNDVGKGSPYIFAPTQKLVLEGDFPNNFQVFAPVGSQIEVLSVFQPDLLQSILRHGLGYDIEFYNNELRVISRRGVTHHQQRQAELQSVATEIIKEMQNRFDAWERRGFKFQPLVVYRLPGIAVGMYYVSFAQLAAIIFLLLPGLAMGVVLLIGLKEAIDGNQTMLSGFVTILFGILVTIVPYVLVSRYLRQKELALRKGHGSHKTKPDKQAERKAQEEPARMEQAVVKGRNAISSDQNSES